jgi:hypothetical protein
VSFTVRATDTAPSTDDQALSITVDELSILDAIDGGVTVRGAYGFRRLKAIATNAIRVKNSVTAVETDLAVNFVKADADALVTGGQQLQVIKIYDQSKTVSPNHLSPGVGFTPGYGILYFDTNDEPYIDVINDVYYRGDELIAFDHPKYFALVRPADTAETQYIASAAGTFTNLFSLTAAGIVQLNNVSAALFEAVPAGIWAVLTAYYQSGNEKAFIDGEEMTFSSGANDTGSGTIGGGTATLGLFKHPDFVGTTDTQFFGRWREFIHIEGAISDPDQALIEADMMAAYPAEDLTPTITTVTLPNAKVGEAYNQTIATTGGDGDIDFSIVAGALPAWASLNTETGAITGTPTAAASAVNFTVRATDADGDTDDQALSITVSGIAGFSVSGLTSGNLEATDTLVINDESDAVVDTYSYRITNSEYTNEVFGTSAEPNPNAYLRMGSNTIRQTVVNGSGSDYEEIVVTVVAKLVTISAPFTPVGGRISYEFSVSTVGVTISGRVRAVDETAEQSSYSNSDEATSTGGGGGSGVVFDSELDGGFFGDSFLTEVDGGAFGDSITDEYDGGAL